jgi:V-type H+-transporting ATPase subunit C
MTSIDHVQKQKLSNYNLAKGSLTGMQRKRTGNLSTRSLVDVVKREDMVHDSEFMETLMVAVPKYVGLTRQDGYSELTCGRPSQQPRQALE